MAKYELVKVPNGIALYKLYHNGKIMAEASVFAMASILCDIADDATVLDDGVEYTGAEYKELLNE